MDWRWLRSFVAVASEGGPRSASTQSGISPATLSRHVKQLEECLGIVLFDRDGRGTRLTRDGAALYKRALDIDASVEALKREALGIASAESGAVRVTMSALFGMHFAPTWLHACRVSHPSIAIDLVIDDAPINLLRREAELAVRLFRPTQLDLIVKNCGTSSIGFFASKTYIATHGAPETLDALHDHHVIGTDRRTVCLDYLRQLGVTWSRDDFVMRTDCFAMHPASAVAGVGVALVPLQVGERAGLVRVLPEHAIQGPPIFLTAHPDLHRVPRLARVWEHLGTALREVFAS